MLTEFYRYWCLKEAFVKATGAGVGFGLQRLEFHHMNWTNISLCIDGEEARKWMFWLFKIDEMHLVCLNFSHHLQCLNFGSCTSSFGLVIGYLLTIINTIAGIHCERASRGCY
jgi:hypothetical protein